MSEDYWLRLVKDLNLRIDHLEFERNMKQEQLDQLTNNWNELEECVESRLMSIPDDICTNEVEEARRTTKIAVYQVILGKMKEIKENNK